MFVHSVSVTRYNDSGNGEISHISGEFSAEGEFRDTWAAEVLLLIGLNGGKASARSSFGGGADLSPAFADGSLSYLPRRKVLTGRN